MKDLRSRLVPCILGLRLHICTLQVALIFILANQVASCRRRINNRCAYQLQFPHQTPREPRLSHHFYDAPKPIPQSNTSSPAIATTTPTVATKANHSTYRRLALPHAEAENGTATSKFSLRILAAPSQRHEAAIKYCAKVASRHWVSSIEVRTKVLFTSSLGNADVLGDARAGTVWFVDGFVYPIAMAKSILQKDLNDLSYGDEKYDIIVRLNTLTKWYLGTDGKPHSGTYDLVTVCLHELYHGLMISGGNLHVDRNGSRYLAKFLFPYEGRFDSFLAAGTAIGDCAISSYRDADRYLADAVTGDNLWFVAAKGRIAQLYAPHSFKFGSSVYHLSESKYGDRSNENNLMTPAMPVQYSRHELGPLMRRMQAIMMDENEVGAPLCDNHTQPIMLSNEPQDKNGNWTTDAPAKGCAMKMGRSCVSLTAIVGIAVGGVLALVLAGLLIWLAVVTIQKKQEVGLPPLPRGDPGNNVGNLDDRFFNY